MIAQYTKPQDTITLLLQRVLNGVARRSNPVIIAPQYLLSRRGSEVLPTQAWTGGTSIQLQYVDDTGSTQNLPAAYPEDAASVTLWGDDLLLKLETGARNVTPVSSSSTTFRTTNSAILSGTEICALSLTYFFFSSREWARYRVS